MALQINISEEKDIVRMELIGRIDSFSIEELNSGFSRVMKTGKKEILMILKDLEYINSRGIGALISFLKWVKNIGGMVKIADVPLNIMQVLNLLGLDGLTLIYDSASDARESFRRQRFAVEQDEERPSPLSHQEPFERPARRTRDKPVYFLWIAGILFLGVIVVFLFRLNGQKGTTPLDLAPLQATIERLEARIIKLEGEKTAAPQPIGRVDGLNPDLTRRLDGLAKELDQIKKEGPSGGKGILINKGAAKPAPGNREKRYHKVNAGESLHHISRMYGLSVAELCRLNHLDRKRFIYPGQRLIVGLLEKESLTATE